MIVLIFVTLAFGFPIGLSIGMGSAAALYIIMPNAKALIIAGQKMFQSVTPSLCWHSVLCPRR